MQTKCIVPNQEALIRKYCCFSSSEILIISIDFLVNSILKTTRSLCPSTEWDGDILFFVWIPSALASGLCDTFLCTIYLLK